MNPDMERIRVAFVPNDFLVGGAQRLHLGVFNNLDPSRYDMHLVTLFEFPGKATLYGEVPSHVTVHRLSFRGFRDIRAWFKLYRTLFSIRPDVVIASLFFANTACRLLKPLVGYSVVATENNTYVSKSASAIFVDRALSHITHRIIAVSETVRDFTARQECIPSEKFIVIRGGTDVEAISRKAAMVDRESVRESLGLASDDCIAINVARLTKQKNQGALIEAFAEFSAARPKHRLLILGEGALYETYAGMIREKRAEDRIRLLGNVMDVVQYYAVSDYFVSSSHIEGFGVAHAEAFSVGLPVLTTKTAGPDEMVREGENGFFIRAPSPQAIREGLEKITSADLKAMRSACLATAARYDIRRMAALYEKAIRSALLG